MSKTVQIGGQLIGDGQPCFIIAEAGVNHNGDIDMARQLIHEAKRIGADCVKFQTFKAERVVTSSAPKAQYQLHTTDPQQSQMDMLRELELNFDAYRDLLALAKELNIVLISTPYNVEDVDFLDAMGFPAFKLASIHLVEPYLLQYVARKGKPLIISTGMATMSEVDTAVRAIREIGNTQFVVLQCTTNYPSRPEDANLRAMPAMRDALDVLVGYSDHTQTDNACIASIALGACVIEKHFTLDMSLPGPDHSSSADPAMFAQLIRNIRETEQTLGTGIKSPSTIEQKNAVGMRRSIVAKRDIATGETIGADMLTFKRPATGLSPTFFDEVVGRVAITNIPTDTLLDWAQIGQKADA